MRRNALTAGAISVALACAGCGSSSTATRSTAGPGSSAVPGIAPQAHPQAVEPVAGAAPQAAAPTGPASVSVSGPGGSGPADGSGSAGGSGSAAGSGAPGGSGSAGGSGALAQPVTLDQVKQELAQSGLTPNTDQSELTPNLLAIAPIGAPPQVEQVINAGNEIAHLPYVWGGGHMTYEDSGYDCSGSISFVLAAAGLLKGTETSGQLMSYGDPGPGKWITIYATQGHTFMYVAGLRFDTVALAQSGSRWSNRSATEGGGFVARHPPGL